MKIRNFFESLLKYPKWAWGFVLLCAAAPLVFGATAFTLFLAFLGVMGCLGAAVNMELSTKRRLLLCGFMTAAVWLILLILSVILRALL
ncbi:MAG: hypothetical protein IJF79_04660 [Clostridia bacterium]|nr:hypothetical protein [Clostridia bacterium]